MKMDRILTKIFYIVCQVLKVLLIKICKIQSLTRSFISCCFYWLLHQQQISFFTSFWNFIQLYIFEKKGFCHKFPFSNRFIQTAPPPSHPLNSQNLLIVTKVFCQCSLTYHGFSILLCYDDTRKN